MADIDRALSAGVHGIELDLRLRRSDRAVVCSHSARGLEERPTLAASIDRILRYRGDSGTVQKDGLQFFLVLDVKERSPLLYRGIVRTLRRYADSWSTTAAGPDGSPRGMTVVVSGGARGLAGTLEAATADSLFILEGQDYRGRIRQVSPEGGRFQWIAIQHPGERGRVRALHAGTDLATPGVFNVRAYDCHRRLAECAAAGVDAVNADLDELPRAAKLSAWVPHGSDPSR
ncbi:MAG TPA: hypothetical protein VER38_05560 [Candidatus Eisenbacteria bacterium]|nr:hypothetical protein [Candidatus Eisenbacteria bacterium]